MKNNELIKKYEGYAVKTRGIKLPPINSKNFQKINAEYYLI